MLDKAIDRDSQNGETAGAPTLTAGLRPHKTKRMRRTAGLYQEMHRPGSRDASSRAAAPRSAREITATEAGELRRFATAQAFAPAVGALVTARSGPERERSARAPGAADGR